MSKLTDAQRWQWQLQVGQDTSITLFGVTIPGGFSPFMTYTQNAANLNGKSVTLSYTPATQADLHVPCFCIASLK
ncbi:hypothetical protein [Parvibium lacunae]|uniref:hypothetical protein n=1 Tax=Parvibium lacunae TaxID=1888893 RepID=UPI0011C05D31|nr:hypothetical protein [Parvibium lacunae]